MLSIYIMQTVVLTSSWLSLAPSVSSIYDLKLCMKMEGWGRVIQDNQVNMDYVSVIKQVQHVCIDNPVVPLLLLMSSMSNILHVIPHIILWTIYRHKVYTFHFYNQLDKNVLEFLMQRIYSVFYNLYTFLMSYFILIYIVCKLNTFSWVTCKEVVRLIMICSIHNSYLVLIGFNISTWTAD